MTMMVAGKSDHPHQQSRARRDLVVAVVLLAMSIGLIVNAQRIPNSNYEPMGARFLAEIVPGLIALLAVCLGFRSLALLRNAPADTVIAAGTSKRLWLRPFLVLLLLLVYGALLQFDLPYIVATAAFIWTAAAILAPNLRPRALVKIGAIGIAVSVVLNFVFVNLLSVLLP